MVSVLVTPNGLGVFAHPSSSSLNYRRPCLGVTRATRDEDDEVVVDGDGGHRVGPGGEKVIDDIDIRPLSQHEEGATSTSTSTSTRPSSVLFDDAEASNRKGNNDRRGGGGGFRFIAACASALTFALAGLAVPVAANAARRGSEPPAAAAVVTTSHRIDKPNPNLIQLPEGTRKKLDDMTMAAVKQLRDIVRVIDMEINDPWMVEDVWLIVVWHYMKKHGLYQMYKLTKKPSQKTEDAVWAEANGWENSFWHWLKNPMRVVMWLWITLYIFDNAVRVGSMLEIPNVLPYSMMDEFDRGSYILAAGSIGIMSTNHWLPGILQKSFSINDTSQRLVLTRLATCMMLIGTLAATALVFGVPASSLLGFGGIGGLTFGLAAKDLISNFIGGSMLAIMRPFSPGEKIYLMSVNGRFRGTNEPAVGGYDVKEIGWYQTTLVPKDTRPTTVPNGFFLGANVINITRQEFRIIVATIR